MIIGYRIITHTLRILPVVIVSQVLDLRPCRRLIYPVIVIPREVTHVLVGFSGVSLDLVIEVHGVVIAITADNIVVGTVRHFRVKPTIVAHFDDLGDGITTATLGVGDIARKPVDAGLVHLVLSDHWFVPQL